MYRKENTKYLNEEIIGSFDEKEKEILFNDISEMYFKKNFGSISKSDLETYLFSFYIEHLLDKGIEFDDYTIGRDLGLTQSRVRSLKERKELKYPREGYNWKEEFLKCAKNAKYDETSRLIKFQIPDVNVIKDARNYFEKHNHYDEYQLNPKLFQCNPESFYELCNEIAIENGENISFELSDVDVIKNIIETSDEPVTVKDSLKKLLTNSLTNSMEEGLNKLLKFGSKKIIKIVLNAVVPGAGFVCEKLFEALGNAFGN